MYWNYEIIPEGVMAAILRYRDSGCPTGSFTQAVLSGNLYEAVRRGDDNSLAALTTIVAWIENNMPGASYGSNDHYKRWMKVFDDLRKAGKVDVHYDHATKKLNFCEVLETGAEPEAINT